MRSNTDPLTEDPAELDARADEDAREKRWVEFVESVGRAIRLHGLSPILRIIAAEHSGRGSYGHLNATPIGDEIFEFAAIEGWDGVLSAIARAMREQGKA